MKIYLPPLGAIFLATAHAQYEFTNNSVGDNLWTNPGNWRLPGVDPAPDFPDNGATATADVASSTLSKDITLSSLTLGGHNLFLNGNTLDITGSLTTSGSNSFSDGTVTFATGNLTGLSLVNSDASAFDITMSNGISLQDGSELAFGGTLDITTNSAISGIGVGTSRLLNQGGVLTKTAGTAFADVSAEYVQSGDAETRCSAGSLRFTLGSSAEFQGGTLFSSSRLILAGDSTLQGVAISLENSGRVEATGPLAFSGTITSSATTPNDCYFFSNGDFSGGTLDFAGDAPFVMNGGSSNPVVQTINEGAFHWDTGELFEFTNNATTSGDFRIGAPVGSSVGLPIVAKLVTNTGHALQEGSPVAIATGATFVNSQGATFETLNSSVQSVNGATDNLFLNEGTVLKTALADNNGSTIASPFTSTGRVEVRDNSLRIIGSSQITNVVSVDRSTNADALLEFGPDPAAMYRYPGLEYQLSGGGLVEFESGQHILSGTHVSNGDSGKVHVRAGGADMIVEAGSSAELAFIDEVPIVFGENNNTPEIRLAGPLVNTGRMDIFLARLLGEAALKNKGDIFLDGTLDIGSTTENGQLTNNGLIDFPTLDGAQIRIFPGSLLVNNELGGPDADTTKGTILLGANDAISSNTVATEVQLFNKADLLFLENGSASINVKFEQSGSNSPLAEAARGSLTFQRDANLQAGIMRSSYLDFASDSTPSAIRFTEDVTLGGIAIELDHGGEFHLAGSDFDGDLYTLTATLTATGEGVVRQSGGTLAPEAGNAGTGFDCSGDTLFELTGGTVGAAGESLSNVGNFDQRGGSIVGTFTNGGKQLLDSGDVEGAFTNTNDFTWRLGTMGGTVSNGIVQTEDVGIMTISGPTNGRILEAGSILTNWNIINQDSNLSCGPGAIVRQNRGVHTLSGGALISPQTATLGQRFEMNGGVLRSDDIPTRSQNITLETFVMEGGLVETAVGNLVVRPDTLVINGGSLSTAADTRLTFHADPSGAGLDGLHSDGEILFDLLASSASSSVILKEGGLVSGSGELEVDLTQNGEAAPGNSVGTLSLTGDLTQGSSATTSIEISPSGSDLLAVSGDVVLGGTLAITLIDGANPAPGETFTILTGASIAGAFTTVQQPGGEVAFDITFNTDSVVLTARAAGMDFDGWAASEFTPEQLADENISGPLANPDGDALANIFEFIVGTAPLTGGDVFPLTFSTSPDPAAPGQRFVTVGLETAAGRAGYELEIVALNDLSTPTDDEVLVSSTSGEPGELTSLTTASSLPDETAFFALRASVTP